MDRGIGPKLKKKIENQQSHGRAKGQFSSTLAA